MRQRHSADFPAAGLRWNVKLNEGQNTLRAVGKRDGVAVSDEITVGYQTQKWGKPATLQLAEIAQAGSVSTLEAASSTATA